MRVGVYVCECGVNISATVDVGAVVNAVKNLPYVVVARHYKYMCSEPGQNLIKEDIREYGLDRVVVASCSPRMHEPTFRAALREAGLNEYCLEMVNIREHCSWVHEDREAATKKAIALVRAGVAKALRLEPLERREISVTPSALVIGGGVAGIQAALDIADRGFKTFLVERTPSIGGHMAQLDKTFPTLDCSACILTPKMVDAARHPNIELITYAEVEEVDGYVGNFRVKVRKKATFVDWEKCTGCGECVQHCPVSVPNEFNLFMDTRKAIYVPFPQAVPLKYTIDKRGVSPCTKACPAGVNPHAYVALISAGKFREAYLHLIDRMPFPGVCGRVCPHPCEEECNRGKLDEPVAIRALKRAVADWAREHADEVEIPRRGERTGKRVAIVGSGPAGLTCAYHLARKGHEVTVFEALPVPGGMLAVGIPDYRLPKDILQEEIRHVENLGVEIKTGVRIEKLEDVEGYDAVFVAAGAHRSRKLNIPGEEQEGVLYAARFLRRVNLGEEVGIRGRVLVIGGGSAAIDSARTAFRLGADEVVICYRRTMSEMPASHEEVQQAIEEGVKFEFLISPVEIVVDGKVRGVKFIKNRLGEVDESGRPRPVPIPGTEFIMEADAVIVSIGQMPDTSFLKDWGIEITNNGRVLVDEYLQTSRKGVFAGGDAVRGPATVVEAIADGIHAAECIDAFLRGAIPNVERREERVVPLEEVHIRGVVGERRVPIPKRPVVRRTGFQEVELAYSEEAAIREAGRCLNCSVCSVCRECERHCEANAIVHSQEDTHLELEVGAIVVATGFDMYDPSEDEKWGYDGERVITGLEFERLCSASGPTGGKITIGGKTPERIVFIQCVGSRERGGREYCSRVCCMYTAKHAHLIKEKIPDAEVFIYYTDVRAFGKGFEEFYNRVKDEGAIYIRRELDDEIRVLRKGEKVIVKCEGHPDMEAALVVLATAIVPREDAGRMASVLNISRSGDGFFLEAHPKLRPVETLTDGIFLAGVCQGPKDIPDTVAQASGAAARACALLSHRRLELEPLYPEVREELCRGCGTCVEVCPYSAIELVEEEKTVARINEAVCKGCGLCASACLSSAIQPRGFRDDQILAAIKALSGGGE